MKKKSTFLVYEHVFQNNTSIRLNLRVEFPGADPGFFFGGGALVSCSTSTPINHIFFWQNTSCIRKPQVISGGEGAHPLHPPPRSAPGFVTLNWEHKLGFLTTLISLFICVLISPQNRLSVQCRGLGTLRRFLFPGRLLRF